MMARAPSASIRFEDNAAMRRPSERNENGTQNVKAFLLV
jgi:hypothetical protein